MYESTISTVAYENNSRTGSSQKARTAHLESRRAAPDGEVEHEALNRPEVRIHCLQAVQVVAGVVGWLVVGQEQKQPQQPMDSSGSLNCV